MERRETPQYWAVYGVRTDNPYLLAGGPYLPNYLPRYEVGRQANGEGVLDRVQAHPLEIPVNGIYRGGGWGSATLRLWTVFLPLQWPVSRQSAPVATKHVSASDQSLC